MKILDSWIRDMPQQFQGKQNIEVLFRAFARQLEEVNTVLAEINDNTDIETASGVNLDHVGDIACLSRKDALEILRKKHNTEISDDLYRSVLRYKVLKNTSECTYEDIMQSIRLLWDTDKIRYYEDPARPATIMILFPMTDIDEPDWTVGRVLAIKPAGVAMIYAASYLISMYLSAMEKANLQSILLNYKFPFFDFLRLDGTWLLDGSKLLMGAVVPMGIGIAYTVKMLIPEEADASVVIRKNYRTFDGSWKLDGSYLLNSEIRKEAI